MKGVSPLLAVVLLIGITVSLSIIIKDWVVLFVNERLYESEMAYATTQGCIKSSFRVVTYTIKDNTLHGILENTGDYDLYNFRITYFSDGKQVTSALNLSLEKHEMKYFSTDLLFIPEKIRLLSKSDACILVYYDLT